MIQNFDINSCGGFIFPFLPDPVFSEVLHLHLFGVGSKFQFLHLLLQLYQNIENHFRVVSMDVLYLFKNMFVCGPLPHVIFYSLFFIINLLIINSLAFLLCLSLHQSPSISSLSFARLLNLFAFQVPRSLTHTLSLPNSKLLCLCLLYLPLPSLASWQNFDDDDDGNFTNGLNTLMGATVAQCKRLNHDFIFNKQVHPPRQPMLSYSLTNNKQPSPKKKVQKLCWRKCVNHPKQGTPSNINSNHCSTAPRALQ